MIVKIHRLHRCGDMRVFHIYVQRMKESILECFSFEGEKENTKLPDMFVACVTNTLACWPFSIWLQVYPILWGFPKSWGYPHLSSIYRSFFHYKPSILGIYRWIFHEINLYWVPHWKPAIWRMTWNPLQDFVPCARRLAKQLKAGFLRGIPKSP